jgi:hypothetical protein
MLEYQGKGFYLLTRNIGLILEPLEYYHHNLLIYSTFGISNTMAKAWPTSSKILLVTGFQMAGLWKGGIISSGKVIVIILLVIFSNLATLLWKTLARSRLSSLNDLPEPEVKY